MSKKIKIGLFGIYGLYNFGCEAIVRGTYGLLHKAWPGCEVILYTSTPDEDQQIINDLDITVKHIPKTNSIIIKRLVNKFLRTISVEKQFLMWDANAVASDCDLIFSIGGDIYTIPKHILDSKKEANYSPIVELGKSIIERRPVVIWGASIGPFGDRQDVKKYYFNHLKEVSQIFCREAMTYNYLKSNNVVSNLELCPDPAFYVQNTNVSKEYSKSEKLRIAVNFSPLSIREQVGAQSNEFKEQIVKTILDLLTIQNSEVVLVPHVLSPLSENDNDLIYLKDIYNSIPKNFHKSISVLEFSKGFLETKEFLKTCDIVIAARMHCAINAVCEGIPTIFLSYSQKGKGMAEYVYGNSKWVVPLLNVEKELKCKVQEMLSKKQIISDELKARVHEMRHEEPRIIELFKNKITF